MKLNIKQIQGRTRELLSEHPEGLRWSDILKRVQDADPETPFNSIRGATHALFSGSDDIIKIARGTYQLAAHAERDAPPVADGRAEHVEAADPVATSLTEQDFYASFAVWLEENDEATRAAALGGASLGGKWGTPDVIGVLKPRAQDIFKFEPQIVTAEIKAVPGQPVVAFGQAVAYRLFSHKTYIVVPESTGGDDMSRLKALCSLHGVGLVTFALDVDAPDYTVVVLPALANPDMFYVNAMLDRLKTSEPKLLNTLF